MWVIILTKYISLNNGKRVYISHNSVHELSIYYRCMVIESLDCRI